MNHGDRRYNKEADWKKTRLLLHFAESSQRLAGKPSSSKSVGAGTVFTLMKKWQENILLMVLINGVIDDAMADYKLY